MARVASETVTFSADYARSVSFISEFTQTAVDAFSATNELNETSVPPPNAPHHDEIPSSDPVSPSTLDIVQTVVNAGILPVLVLCGVTGNVINMAVFVRQGLRDRVNVCLFSLAVSDAGYNLFHFASRIYVIFFLIDTELAEYWQARGLIFVGVYGGFVNTSNCMNLIISLERCICVIFPLKAKTLLSARQMALIVLSVFAVCLVGTGFGSFKYEPHAYIHPATNVTRYRTGLTDFYLNNRRLVDSIFEVTFNATVCVVAVVVVIAATIVIATRMRSVAAWRKQAAHVGASQQTTVTANQREAAVTRMLFVVCLVYAICTTPSAVNALARNFLRDFVAGGPLNNVFFVTLILTHLLEVINCSVNIIIYYTMSTRYRDTLWEMIGRRGTRKQRHKTATESETKLSVISASSG